MTPNGPNRSTVLVSQPLAPKRTSLADVPVGVVGLGLMGTSIVACLLAAGHPVAGVESDPTKRRVSKRNVLGLLKELKSEGLLKQDSVKVAGRLTVSSEFSILGESQAVFESINENVEAKRQVLRKIEEVLSPEALIGSNTSAIPVTELQRAALHPERIVGIHWAEPAHITRFMEIICGRETQLAYAERAITLAGRWGKDPSLLRRDVRGFITNRCFYALVREALHLVESGLATPEDIDRSLRNDLGYWITFAGPFRFMDITGVSAYAAVMKDLFPDLSCNTKVPLLVGKLVESGARGISNGRGFYRYTPQEAKRWEKRFLKFTYEIRGLADKYAESHRADHLGRRKRLL